MIASNFYSDLNISEGASMGEIKAAFRHLAKSYHPDSATPGQADVDKFIKAQTAYQKLMAEAKRFNRIRRATTSMGENVAADAAPKASRVADNWRFVSRFDLGLDVYYRLTVLRPKYGATKITLPWQAQEACPCCLGHGRTLSPTHKDGSVYRPSVCPKCGGTGVVSRATNLEVTLTPDMARQGKIRLRKAGLYNVKTAQRGDLILEITWADSLPKFN